MRKVVSITFDSPHIDRRILLIGRSLGQAGYQTRVLSPKAEKEKGFEDIETTSVTGKLEERPPAAPRAAMGRFKAFIKQILLRYRTCEALIRFYFETLNRIRNLFEEKSFLPASKEMCAEAVAAKADLYVANDLPALPVGVEAKKANGSILIYDSHEFYSEQAVFSRKKRKYLKKLESQLIQHADLVITVNEDIAEIFRRTYGLTNVEVILNAAAINDIEPKYLHDLIGIDRSNKIVLFQGGFSPNRNLERLVRIASHIRNGVLIMLGWGDLEKELKREAEKLGILDRKLFLVPKIGQDDLISYTASASLGLIPYPPVDINTTYCTPNKLFEFISARVPILANQGLVTVKDFLSRYQIGTTVDFTDEQLAARVIDEIVADAVRTNDLRHNLETARGELNWSQESRKLMRIVKETIENKVKAEAIRRQPSERGSKCAG